MADAKVIASLGVRAGVCVLASTLGLTLALQDNNNLVVYRKDSCQAVWARR